MVSPFFLKLYKKHIAITFEGVNPLINLFLSKQISNTKHFYGLIITKFRIPCPSLFCTFEYKHTFIGGPPPYQSLRYNTSPVHIARDWRRAHACDVICSNCGTILSYRYKCASAEPSSIRHLTEGIKCDRFDIYHLYIKNKFLTDMRDV